jgi:uncharacterized protein (TIGR04255 family)
VSFRDLAYERVRYDRSGLKTVVCQLSYNPILKIGQELPTALQDDVRGEFPKFVKEASTEFRLSQGAVEALPSAPATWHFKTEDDAWSAILSINSLSLETAEYSDFHDFERRLSIFEQGFQRRYPVDHYNRVGLRYINLFDANAFPGGWRERLNPQLLGPLRDDTLGNEVIEGRQIIVLEEPDEDWGIRIQHGTDNGGYRLDIDHYTNERVEAGDVIEHLRAFNRRIYQVFRWAISDTLHEEMEPRPHD